MKPKHFLFGLIVFILAGVLILPYLAGRPVRTRTTVTISHLARILMDIDLLSQEITSQFRKATEGGADSLTLNRTLGALLKASGDKDISAGRLLAADGFFRDAWGTPLLFIPTNSVSYERLNPELKGKPRVVVVWSAGPNKINEFGSGDDVLSHW